MKWMVFIFSLLALSSLQAESQKSKFGMDRPIPAASDQSSLEFEEGDNLEEPEFETSEIDPKDFDLKTPNEKAKTLERLRRTGALSGEENPKLQSEKNYKNKSTSPKNGGGETEQASSEKTLDDLHSDWTKDALRPRKPEKKSAIEDVFLGKFPILVSRDLTQFGYEIFSQKPSSFTALEDTPISPDYVVGPGDSFTINVWGGTNFTRSVTIRRDGTIFISKVGAIRVWGQTFKEMTTTIEKKLSSFFSGAKVNISFDTIRQIDVFVIGEVKQPGSYATPSTASPINALFHAGGPTKSGSLRHIQLLRNNQIIETIDLYDFLIAGKANRQKLQSQDVILVPVVGKMVAIAGNVKRPAIYEIKANTSLYDLISMSGGLSFTGQIGRLSLERVNKNKERVTKDFQLPENFSSLSEAEAAKTDLATEVQDGDLIKIFPVLTSVKKTIYLRGHVKRPGSYEFKEGMSVKDILSSFDIILPEPYTDYVQIIRLVPPKDEKQSLFVPLQRLIDGDPASNVALQERDEIVVFSKKELNLQETVFINGKVNKPGQYLFFKGMRLRDLIFMAGNLTKDAYLANAEIARYQVASEELKLDRLQVNLKETLTAGASSQNPLLQPKDRVFIQGLPDWQIENFVSVLGEVRFPGQYPFLPGEKLSTVIERAGGFTTKAFLSGAVFTRRSVKEIQQKALREQVSQLEEAVLQESVRPSQYLSAQDMQTFQQANIARKDMLKKLQSAEVTGRMLIRVNELRDFKNGPFDIPLEATDSLIIPPTPSVVTIQGEVYNPTAMVFVDGKTVQYYLEKAGGSTPNADNESIFVIKSDGSVISRRQNRGFLLRNFYQTTIDRGDSILVPKDITQFSWLNTTKDITEILFKIASTTGITITALK